jgi:hypothetical protein
MIHITTAVASFLPAAWVLQETSYKQVHFGGNKLEILEPKFYNYIL